MHHRAFGLDRYMEVAEETLPKQSCDPWREFGYSCNDGLDARDSHPAFVWDVDRSEDNPRAHHVPRRR
jgi:hypothetical protein